MASDQSYSNVKTVWRPKELNDPAIQWDFIHAGDGFKIQSRSSGMFLALEGGSTAARTKIITWEDEGQEDLIWQFEEVPTTSQVYKDRKVVMYFTLHYIAAAELTRNRLDHPTCKDVTGSISFKWWDQSRPTERQGAPGFLYNEKSYFWEHGNNSAAYSYYQDGDINAKPKMATNSKTFSEEQMIKGDLGYWIAFDDGSHDNFGGRVPSADRKTFGTQHRDNNFATTDFMTFRKRERPNIPPLHSLDGYGFGWVHKYYPVKFGSTSQVLQFNLDGGDDTHRMWVKISTETF